MPELIALIGPTAVGKTDVSIELAKSLGAEIVGCDSMQVYRHMSVLTQQPTPEQRAAIPHHLIDCVEPTEPFNVGQYRQAALAAIEDIQRRGKTALLVGGTGLYLKALTNGLCEAPPANDRIREALLAEANAQGSPALHTRLHQVDPVAAAKIHPHDARRLVRALEVYELTGKPLSSFWRWGNAAEDRITVIGLTRERNALYERINRRVERMIHEEGVLEETRRLTAQPLSRTASQVHGLQYLDAYLKGQRSLAETIQLWQQQVRNYARRQLIWFRAERRIQWLELNEEPASRTVERILAHLHTADAVSGA